MEAISPLQILLLLGVAFVSLKLPAVLRWLRIWFTIRKLPTPAGASLISGHLHLFSPLSKHKFEEKNSKQLGPIYRQRYLARQVVVVASPELQQEVWAAEREGKIEKPDQMNGFHAGKSGMETNVFSSKSGDPMWKLVRKGTASAFAPQNLRNYHHHIVDIVDRLSEGIRQRGGPVDIADIAQRESFDVIGKVGFGRDFQASKDITSRVNTFQLISDNLEEGIRRIFNPWRKYSRSKAKLAGDENHKKIRKIYLDLVDECLKRPPSDEDANSIAGHLLRLRDANGQRLSRKRLIEEFAIFFIAGSETTGHTVAWTLYFLAKNPKAMAKLEAELDTAGLLKTPQNPTPRQFTHADIGKLRYLDWCITESMRLQPVAANSLRRLAVKDVRLSNGVVLPAGVSVEMAQYSIFRNPAWGWKDPMSYVPERWADPEEDYYKPEKGFSMKHNGKDDDLEIDAGDVSGGKLKRMHPFGQGIRNCLGQQLAKINIPTAVAMLLREFHMELAPETASKDISELEVLKVTLQPKDGIMMLCKPR